MKISGSKLNLLNIPAVISMILAVIHTVWWGICAGAWLHFILNEGKTYWPSVIVAVVCFGIGVLWVSKTWQKIRFVRDCRKYYIFLEGCTRISVDEFAAVVKDSPEKVRKNLINMISCGYIEGIALNVHDDCITVLDQIRREARMIPVTCEACCGVTRLPANSVGVCDYCGSKIHS